MYILQWISNNGDAGDRLYIILLLELTPGLMKSVTFVLYYIGMTNFLLARANIPAYLELLLWYITVYPLTLSFLNDIEWRLFLWVGVQIPTHFTVSVPSNSLWDRTCFFSFNILYWWIVKAIWKYEILFINNSSLLIFFYNKTKQRQWAWYCLWLSQSEGFASNS